MCEKNKKTRETEECILAEIAEILCGPDERLELHQLSAGPLLMKGSMTVAEVLDMLSDLHTLTEHLLDSLRKACGPCTEYCPEDCPLRFVEPFRMSNDLLGKPASREMPISAPSRTRRTNACMWRKVLLLLICPGRHSAQEAFCWNLASA